MSHLQGLDLASAASVSSTWSPVARATADALLRRRIPALPRHSTCLNWVRAFASLDAFERSVGPKPAHCWWNEWPELRMAETKMAGAPCGSAEVFRRGGGGSCSRALLKYSRGIGWMVATGWPTLHAAACLLLGAGGTEAMGHALRTGSSHYAASAHALWESLLVRAAHLTLACPGWTAPPTYACIGGRFGLLVSDPAWSNLLRPGVTCCAAPGTTFVTSALVQTTSNPVGTCSEGALGSSAGSGAGGAADASAALCSDVVVFLSQPADSRGHRSLLLSSPQGYHLPPMASITLERVEPASAPHTGVPVRRFVVTVVAHFEALRGKAAP
eukprot:CAMPEP_0119078608 /NCGR_PEP_ID=MMETSP1178-20130426/101839_1 /TAXON_ID=33656 /ORGANISM="unid sp, Strain CCMP2000" /LENGTH=328 /DNA_ID=CAMNT_0007061065 /DNA_START=151 /DNA_END=1138 /DNA_ORIENTATION=-